ncbi:MAG: glycoside hydrolase family 3 protein [Acidobacteriota bacterium]
MDVMPHKKDEEKRPITRLTRRQFLAQSAQGIAALAWLAACAPQSNVTPIAPPAPPETTPTHVPSPTVSLDAKIGQMILVGFRGFELAADNPIVHDLRERQIGGVVLFDYDAPTRTRLRNIQSPLQVKALCTALQKTASTRLLIAVDQEGGMVARLNERYGFPPTVSAQYLGSLDRLETTRDYAETTARTLADLGINLNLAPVVDLNINPQNPVIGKIERSFSADLAVVTRHALEVVRAHHKYGVLTTLKHFPGHGNSKEDSHLGLVDVTKTWSPVDLEPFSKIIAAGECDTVMTAHIFNATLDPLLPATLSALTLGGILREALHFEGVIISDDMQMKAITDHYGIDSAVELAIRAGVDILTIANNSIFDRYAAATTVAVIQRLVQDGKISAERIDQSYQRITRLKARLV